MGEFLSTSPLSKYSREKLEGMWDSADNRGAHGGFTAGEIAAELERRNKADASVKPSILAGHSVEVEDYSGYFSTSDGRRIHPSDTARGMRGLNREAARRLRSKK